ATTLFGVAGIAVGSTFTAMPESEQRPSNVPDGVAPLYIITYQDAGLLHYQGDIRGLASTSPEKMVTQRKLNVNSVESRAYSEYLQSQRATYLAAIESDLERSIKVQHEYSVTLNGIAAVISAEEAERIRKLPGVKSVVKETFE